MENEAKKNKQRQKMHWKKAAVLFSKVLLWIFIIGLLAGCLAGGAVAGYVASILKEEPIRDREFIESEMDKNALTGFIYFRDGSVVGQIRTSEDRRLATLSEIPPIVKDAFIAIEDTEFEKHPGINIKGTLRAVKQKLLNEEVQTGGSTITQQLVRRVFLSLEKTTERKVKEIFLALRVERFMSKDQIMLAYLNKIPFGNGSNGYNLYGIKAAAKGIFNIDNLYDLNLAQAAYLAGLPQQPSAYSAFTSKGEIDEEGLNLAIERQRLVLKRMLEENKITEKEYQEALAFDIKSSLAKPSQKAYTTFPFLMLEAERKAAEILLEQEHPELAEADKDSEEYQEALKYAREKLQQGGYHIYTTIDPVIYDLMQKIASNPENFSPDHPEKGMEQIGAIMIENQTGAILGMIEGRDFYKEQLNHATQMLRQPGSAMKPLAAFLPAIEAGKIQPASIIDDIPILLPDGQKGIHIPANWDNKFHGLITARHALNQSYNIPAIHVFLNIVGIEQAWDFVKKLGITSLNEEDNHARTGVIGGLKYGVSVEELTNAYSAIPNRGIFNDAYMIQEIRDSHGNVIYRHEAEPVKVFSEQTAYIMTDMLRTVITGGTATDLLHKFKHYKQIAVAGKTGSTQNDADAWFVGFTPDITVGVWAGYDLQIHSLSVRTGGTARAKNIWAMIMDQSIEKRPELFPNKQFEIPEGIVRMTVSSATGKLPNELAIQNNLLVTDIFNKKDIPTEVDDAVVQTKVVTYNGIHYLPHPNTPPDMVREIVGIKRAKPLSALLKELEGVQSRLNGGIQRYLPQDRGTEAPVEVDPRQDDGKVPAPPSNVSVTQNGGNVEISFSKSGDPDIVGYRIYKATANSSFQKFRVVLNGQETKIMDSFQEPAYYYVTAVDVVGKESSPSVIVGTDGRQYTRENLPPLPDKGEKPEDEGDGEQGKMPSPPKNIRIEDSDDSKHQLRWKANPVPEKVIRYHIYYSESRNGSYEKIGSTNATRFEISKEGWYRVTAENATGESKPSPPERFRLNE